MCPSLWTGGGGIHATYVLFCFIQFPEKATNLRGVQLPAGEAGEEGQEGPRRQPRDAGSAGPAGPTGDPGKGRLSGKYYIGLGLMVDFKVARNFTLHLEELHFLV